MKKADFNRIAEKYHISPITARLIRNRDITGDDEIDLYLNGTIADLCDGMLMRDMDRAMEILAEKIREEKKIRVIGDYDIDGVNATYILQEGLAGLGADVDTDIPDRIRDGYGLNKMLIDRALDDGIDTIVTCDNGIAAAEEIAYGKEQGLTVVVTDHHEVPYIETNGDKEYLLPPADAVVDPKLPGCAYPFREICGATVAFKLVQELFLAFGLPGLSGGAKRERGLLDELLELAAFATICDVMPLRDENRILVRHGLSLMQDSQNEGLRALMEVCGVGVSGKGKKLTAFHIGFVLGPCMNASRRLDTAVRALSLIK